MSKKPGYNPNSKWNQAHKKWWSFFFSFFSVLVSRKPVPKHDIILESFKRFVTLRVATLLSKGKDGISRISCSVYFDGIKGSIAPDIYDWLKKNHRREIEDGLNGYEVDWRDSAKRDRQIRIYSNGSTLDKDQWETCAKWMYKTARPLMLKVIKPLVEKYAAPQKIATKKAKAA
jgi:hypothetical protein